MVLDYEADMSLDWSTYQLSILSACRTSSFCDRKWVFWHWLHNPTQWEFLLYNPTQWEALSVTENRCVYTDYTMRVLTTQSYTMRVLFVIKKKQVCVHRLHNPCSYTTRVLLSVTLSTRSYAMGALVWLADMWDCESSGRWFGSWMWKGEGSFFSSYPLSQCLCRLSSACLAFV